MEERGAIVTADVRNKKSGFSGKIVERKNPGCLLKFTRGFSFIKIKLMGIGGNRFAQRDLTFRPVLYQIAESSSCVTSLTFIPERVFSAASVSVTRMIMYA